MKHTLAFMVSACLAACSTPSRSDGSMQGRSGDGSPNRIPEFPMKALQSPHVMRGKLYLAADGKVEKYTVYVTKDGVPAWVHEMADEKIGKGEPHSFEVEQYDDGSNVYEVKRKVGGKLMELSVRTDRSIKYIERQLEEKDIPEAGRAVIKSVANFMPEGYFIKEGPAMAEYQIRGKIGELQHRIRLRKDGSLVAVQKFLPATFEIAVPR